MARHEAARLHRRTPLGNQALQATYTNPDPRPFYRCQKTLDYQIPTLCGELVPTLAKEWDLARGITVIDMGCSFGITAASIRCNLTMDQIYHHYSAADHAQLSISELLAQDRRWFRRHRGATRVRMFGFDVSAQAVQYACMAGLLDRGWVCDLEREQPASGLVSAMREVDLVIGTGVFSYITPRTVVRLVEARSDNPPWLLAFPLRLTDYRPFIATLDNHGLRTVRLNTRPIAQQRVGSDAERSHLPASEGTRPSVVRREGHLYYLADCFLSFPNDQTKTATAIAMRLRRIVDQSSLLHAAA